MTAFTHTHTYTPSMYQSLFIPCLCGEKRQMELIHRFLKWKMDLGCQTSSSLTHVTQEFCSPCCPWWVMVHVQPCRPSGTPGHCGASASHSRQSGSAIQLKSHSMFSTFHSFSAIWSHIPKSVFPFPNKKRKSFDYWRMLSPCYLLLLIFSFSGKA